MSRALRSYKHDKWIAVNNAMQTHGWAASTVVSVLLIVLIEAYALAQKEWTPSYRSLSLYLFLQVLEVAVAVACYQALLGSSLNRSLVLLSRVINGACIVYGLKFLIIVSVDTAECSSLDSKDRNEAEKCIDIYENYAAISNGGADSPCASLNANTETLLGGVCPTVYLGHSTGIVVLAFEIAVVVMLLAQNMCKIGMASAHISQGLDLDPNSGSGSGEGYTLFATSNVTKPPGFTTNVAKEVDTKKKKTQPAKVMSTRKPMGSIYGGR